MSHRILAAALVVATAGCELARDPISPGTNAVQVSAVLNPTLADQTVLVERVHVGRAPIDTTPFDPSNPVATGFGLPISGARVVIEGPSRDSVVLDEDLATRGVGAGVYRFSNTNVSGGTSAQRLPVVAGGHYSLHITTPDGAIVTGETTIPLAMPASVPTAAVDSFDRSGPPLTLSWPTVPSSDQYALVVESPRAPYLLVLPDTSVALDGSLRHPWEGLELVFVPGFTEMVTVVAMDRNFYDFYRPERSSNAGSRSHLQGGYGVFGSVVPIAARSLAVTMPLTGGPPAGRWSRVDAGSSPSAPAQLQLFVSDRQGSGWTISGNYADGNGSPRRGVLGQQHDDSLSLALLPGWSARDTLAVVEGSIRGDTLLLAPRGSATPTRYLRAP